MDEITIQSGFTIKYTITPPETETDWWSWHSTLSIFGVELHELSFLDSVEPDSDRIAWVTVTAWKSSFMPVYDED